MDIILASLSSRRSMLLRQLGLSFTTQGANINEKPKENESAVDLVKRLSAEKALSVARDNPTACVIGADTVVVQDGKIFGKPNSEQEALQMLQLFAGKQHDVLTGLFIWAGGKMWQKTETTHVQFIDYDPLLCAAYVASGEPYDKAGGYGIQGRGGIFVKKIDGDFYNVVGLSLSALREGFEALGLESFLHRALTTSTQTIL